MTLKNTSNLPDFLGVGAPKCGTTSLHDILSEHPDIFLPPDKELHFFDNPEAYIKGPQWYADQFVGNAMIKGEFTPAYMSYEATPERIFKTMGNKVKLIFMFREPVERAFSEYQHNYRRGLLNRSSFEEAIAKEMSWSGNEPYERRHFSFIHRGHYSDHVQQFLKYFSKDQMLFIRFKEDFIDNKSQCISEVLEFLGAGEHQLDINRKSNASFVPKSRLIAKALQKDHPMRKIARSLIGNRTIRKNVRAFVNRTNSSTEKADKLTISERRVFQERYYPNEQEKLEALIGKPLPSWDLNSQKGIDV